MISLLVQLFSNKESTSILPVPRLLASSKPVSWNRSSSIGFTEPLGDPYEAPGHPSSRARWFGASAIRYFGLGRPGSASTPLRRSLNWFLLLTIRNDAPGLPVACLNAARGEEHDR